jgi:surface-anchored protein
VAGPGELAIYNVDSFGSPQLSMNSRDGINRNDRIDMVAGGHQHKNFAFSRPGIYRVTFQASATLLDGTPVQSRKTTYTIEVRRN